MSLIRDYEKILKEGKREEWYGDMVPSKLITGQVRVCADMIIESINKLESELDDLKGSLKVKKRDYINRLLDNVKNLPYKLNGDFTLNKKRRIELELKEQQEKTNIKKTIKKPRKKTTKGKTNTSQTRTKNSELIFGKKSNK